MPSRTRLDRLSGLHEEVHGSARYQDLCLALLRAKDRSTLLFAGGRWDRLDRRFAGEPEQAVEIELEESQVEFTRWFASFLSEYRTGKPRHVSLALVSGDRRGGKTFDTYFCQIAALLDVPTLADGQPTIGWTISRTYRHRDELDLLINSYMPAPYYHQRKAPEHRFTFAHGSILRNLSAEDPDALKQGRVDFLLYNEAQLMNPRAIRNGLYGTADAGGLCVLAANPPSGPQGDWLRDLKEGMEHDEEMKRITRFFNFMSSQNTKVDQPARKRVVAIARKIDPDMADVDADGVWKRWGEMAYPAWDGRTVDKGGCVAPAPEVGAVDVTTILTRRLLGTPHAFVIGGDFQRRPQAAAVLRCFEVPGVDGPIYWFVDEVGVKGTEVELSTELLGAPHSYTQRPNDARSAVWVADCSGSWQGAQRIAGRTSFGLLEAEGWIVHAAELVNVHGKSDHPKNPDVAQRLGLMQRLMVAGRVRVDPACEWLRESFARCQLRKTDTGRRVPVGRYAHVTDAASYAIWRLEPKPMHGRPPEPGAIRSLPRQKGSGFL